jgi:hypothetical protein
VRLVLTPGAYTYDIERGPEYRMATGSLELATGDSVRLNTALTRIANLAAEGWWSGETHVHRPTNDIQLLMQAEDLHVVPVITWWNKQNPWTAQIPDKRLVQFDGNRFYHVMGGEDEREGGALLYFHLDEPLPIGNAAREHPSSAKFLADARRHPGVWVDIEKPYWYDVPIWLAAGVDSVGLACNHMLRDGMYESEAWGRARDAQRLPPPRGNGFYTQEIYYHILNTGLRLPPTAGSASGVMQNPVGYNRVYVHLAGELTWEKWWEGLRAGRCFVSNGPLLRGKAGGQWPGHVFTGDKPIEIELEAQLAVRDTISAIEIIVNGRVERTVPFEEWQRTGKLGKLRFAESGWFLVRAIADNPKTFRFASTAPWYLEIGGRKKRVSRASVEYFLDWARERMGRIKVEDPAERQEVLAFHRSAEKFWQDKLNQANAE